MFVSRLEPGNSVAHPLAAGRGAYLYLIDGSVELNGQPMATGDAAKVTDEPELAISAHCRRAS